MLGPAGKTFHMQSETLIAIDVAKFRALGDFEADVTALVETMRALPRATIRLFDEAGHLVLDEAPGAVTAIGEFMSTR